MSNPDDNDIIVIDKPQKLSIPQVSPDDVWDMALSGVISDNSKRVYRAGMLNFARYMLEKAGSCVPNDAEETLSKATPLLPQVTFPFVTEYRNWLRGEGYSASTINTRLAAIDFLFSRMKRLELIEKNPADSSLVQRMKTSGISNTDGLEKDEATKLLMVCVNDKVAIRGKRDLAIFSIMIFNGLRRSEVIQIDLDKIKKVGDVNTTTLTIKRGKELSIEFIPDVWKAIKNWVDMADIKNGPVFRRLIREKKKFLAGNTRLTANGLYTIIKARNKEAGIKKNIHPHSLRHTYATLALLGGVPIQDVQISMGHSSTNTTFRYYRAIDQVGRSPGRKIDIEIPEKGKGDDK